MAEFEKAQALGYFPANILEKPTRTEKRATKTPSGILPPS